MTRRQDPCQSYRTVTTLTAPPEHLVLMLYEGVLRFLERSLTGFEFTDPLDFNQTINNNVQRAQAIIHEINSRLDMEAGGEVSLNFRRLYNYLYRRLQEANMKKSRQPIEEVIGHMRELRDSWAEMLRRRTEETSEQEPALEAAG